MWERQCQPRPDPASCPGALGKHGVLLKPQFPSLYRNKDNWSGCPWSPLAGYAHTSWNGSVSVYIFHLFKMVLKNTDSSASATPGGGTSKAPAGHRHPRCSVPLSVLWWDQPLRRYDYKTPFTWSHQGTLKTKVYYSQDRGTHGTPGDTGHPWDPAVRWWSAGRAHGGSAARRLSWGARQERASQRGESKLAPQPSYWSRPCSRGQRVWRAPCPGAARWVEPGPLKRSLAWLSNLSQALASKNEKKRVSACTTLALTRPLTLSRDVLRDAVFPLQGPQLGRAGRL